MHKHVVSGMSAALELRRYLREPLDHFCIFEDSLVLGPLSPVTDINNFISLRSNFWRDNSYDDFQFKAYALEEFITRVKEADSYTIWLAPGTDDQIFWAWLICLLDFFEKDLNAVKVRHLFNEKENAFPYMTLGELDAKDYALCRDLKIDNLHLETLREAYEALCSSTPEKLLFFLNKKDCPLPIFQNSLQAYVKLYPDIITGLTITEKSLLSACKENYLKSAMIIGDAMVSDEYYHYLAIGDSYLFRQLIKLSQKCSAYPLVEVRGDIKDSYSMRWSEVCITEIGKQVLSGQRSKAQLEEIDLHIGGVHLSSKSCEPLWFYDQGTLKRLAA